MPRSSPPCATDATAAPTPRTAWARCPTRTTGCSAPAWRAARGATGARPVLLNNWEGTYFDFDEERIVAIAQASKDLGAELFVLDDGWFGDRNDDHRALGDWFVNTTKLPGGLTGLGQAGDRPGHRLRHLDRARDGQCRQRAVPDPPGVGDRRARDGPRTETRNQLVLDMSNPVVVDHLATTLIDVLQSAHQLHQVGLQPVHHRAVRARPGARPPGRVPPPVRARPVRAVPPADRTASRASSSSPAPAAAAASTQRCWPSRRRPGPPTTRTPSSG